MITRLCVSLALLPATLPAQQLGALRFQNSGSAAAQASFVRGALYLHSFEYPSALLAFREAERLDPGFVMAYWGEAMTWTHPVWNEQNLDSARATLARLGPTVAARRARAKTPREVAWLSAIELLYGAGSKPHRDTVYSAAMGKLARAYPDDDEAQLFYALSLLGLNQGDRDIATYGRAGAIAQQVFARHPDHPGAAHYVIHAYDDPAHANLGLAAARAYGAIAPDAAHALHMTTHIFLALGLWDDVVRANENAVRVLDTQHAHKGQSPVVCGHYSEWLAYGYQQQGRMQDAAHLVTACAKSGKASGTTNEDAGGMIAAYLIDSHDWTNALAATGAPAAPGTDPWLVFGRAYAAAMRSDLAAARSNVTRFDSVAKRMDPGEAPFGRVMAIELHALLRAVSRDSAGAIAILRDAARIDDSLPMPFGPPVPVKPPHELLGEFLLAMGKADDARIEFTAALARTPRRPLAVLGLMRSQEATGRSSEASASRVLLKQLWTRADAGLPGVPH